MDSESRSAFPNHSIGALCQDITSTCQKFKIILNKLEHSRVNGKQGVSLFDVKADAMFSYLSNILYLMLKKSCGLSITEEATREKLGEIRIILEKIKPLELKMKYQIEKYLKMMNTGKDDVMNKTNFRAKIENLKMDEEDGDADNDNIDNDNDDVDNYSDDDDLDVDDGGEEDRDKKVTAAVKSINSKEKAKVAIYRPPKVAAVPYDDGNEEEKRKRKLEHAKKRALNTSIMQELKEEYLDTPLEVSNAVTLRNKRTNFRQEKESYEETYFTRLPTTKKERHRDKLMSSLTLGTLGTEVTRFEDISALEDRTPRGSNKRKMKTTSKKKNKGFKKRRF